jgi:3-oxoacyl-[acyl-carrier protein] reductase
MWRPDALSGKVALVTGASRGIGREVARGLVAAGAEVWLNGRDLSSLEEVCAELSENAAAPVRSLSFDVSDGAAVKAGFAQIQKTNHRLDVLVNNAGVMRGALIEMTSSEVIDEALAVNLRGVLLCAQMGARLMTRAGSGSIINMASIVARVGSAGQAAYAASKAGVIGATLSLAKELASRQIRVNAIAPGIIDTDLLDDLPAGRRDEVIAAVGMGRIGAPNDIAPLVVFLASDSSSYITGQVIGVDGGLVI